MVFLSSKGKAQLDAFISTLAKEGKIPAYVAGATTADGELYFNASGKKIVGDESSGDVNADSVFWVCSMTKLLTHISALQLIEHGNLDPETPVVDILPQIGQPVIVSNDVSNPPKAIGTAKNVLRVKHLLNFTSGLYNVQKLTRGTIVPDPIGLDYDVEDPHTAFFDKLKGNLPGVPLKFEPGTDFVYGYSSDVLGFVVEKITGQTLDAYMQAHIFQPIGVKASFYLTGELKEKILPIAYRHASDRRLEPWTNQPDTKILQRDPAKVTCIGGWGIYTSLRDYLSILRHLLQILDGKASKPIISLETAKSLFVPTLSENEADSLTAWMDETGSLKNMSWSNAIAVTKVDWQGKRKAGSGHWGGWLGTSFWIDPATGIAGVNGVQLLCVTAGSGDEDVIMAFDTFERLIYSSLE
ncbi:hypothetical protein D9619_011754 [Psilocybe cf. subviscida]|uniref:Beta-lactamase-related domain-containing protein n=1 Tax=Psilocybe cf. subviscida TaxID=2480587 RepID=A0A8H5EW97_9AGAR|nr:hypothetical protein D9619_011754 [Psilocybe cf. subviscida]